MKVWYLTPRTLGPQVLSVYMFVYAQFCNGDWSQVSGRLQLLTD